MLKRNESRGNWLTVKKTLNLVVDEVPDQATSTPGVARTRVSTISRFLVCGRSSERSPQTYHTCMRATPLSLSAHCSLWPIPRAAIATTCFELSESPTSPLPSRSVAIPLAVSHSGTLRLPAAGPAELALLEQLEAPVHAREHTGLVAFPRVGCWRQLARLSQPAMYALYKSDWRLFIGQVLGSTSAAPVTLVLFVGGCT